MQHVEFFHRDHFHQHFHRKKAKLSLSKFIDFFWETDFENLWTKYPHGFTDALFPDIGYTYLINLGTPFKMQLDDDLFEIKSDAFLPRYKNILTMHSPGNKIFGIKFKVSPVLFQKKINFFEYKEYIFPLTYLIDKEIIEKIKSQDSFLKRLEFTSAYYDNIIRKYTGSMKPADVVTDIIKNSYQGDFNTTIEKYAKHYNISTRTLQRYFEATTSITGKQALQIIRIRKAIAAFVESPSSFNYSDFGYCDYSHFYKHINQFLKKHKTANIQSHLQLLQGSGIINY
ncbi:MAG TPA: AraC family transcriptional regulator [Chitinophagaceae bacterium]